MENEEIEEITKYNLIYKEVECTGVEWTFYEKGYNIFYFTYRNQNYVFHQTEYIYSNADTDHIRMTIDYQFFPYLLKDFENRYNTALNDLAEQYDKTGHLQYENQILKERIFNFDKFGVMTTPIGDLPINTEGMRKLVDVLSEALKTIQKLKEKQ